MDPLKPEQNTPALSKVDAIFISKIEEVNWLLNLRAIGKHEYDPLFNAFILATRVRSNKPVYGIHVYVEDQESSNLIKDKVIKSNIPNCTV
jgi:hypothetical protein